MADPFHAMDVAAAAAALGTDPRRGLSRPEASARLRRFGRNTLAAGGRTPWPRLLAAQLTDTLVIVLLAAAAVSGLWLRDAVDALSMLAIVILNAALGFAQHYRAEEALARLRELAAPAAGVVRDGQERRLPAAELVPGDLIHLRAGDRVPADARLVQAHHLQTSEAVLTGESFPEAKGVEAVPAAAPIADRTSMVFMGTSVATGRGTAIVTATGPATEMGDIAAYLGEGRPPTALQAELARLGRAMGVLAAGVVAALSLLAWRQGYPLRSMFLTAVALAVSVVPEGLPALVTITLARGVEHLARRRAIVRRMQAVEALGAVSVICTDKTGTLTRDRIRVEEIVLLGIRGAPGELPAGDWRVARYAEVAALCNDAAAEGGPGDPLELALLASLPPLGRSPAALRDAFPRVDEAAFDSARKRMSTLHRDAARRVWLLAVKGAPEAVLGRSRHVAAPEGARPLDESVRAELLAETQRLGSRGLRTLAVAFRELEAAPAGAASAERELTLVGLVAFSDEVRPEAAPSVAAARAAGIRVVMVTGDHAETAAAFAREVGILDPGQEVMTGDRLAALPPERLAEAVPPCAVFARVDPADKVRIVQAWQRLGEVVAMTGDGINDAPALHLADVGVAMGSGSDVSRDAADVVLADDNFATLVDAVREGRAIFQRVRRAIQYLLTTNASELLVMVTGFIAFGHLGEPLLPTQLLWINLLTDGLPVLALASQPPDQDPMRLPVRHDRGVVDPGAILLPAVLLAAAAFGALVYGHDIAALPWPQVQTLVFTTLATVQLSYAIHRGGRVGRGSPLLLAVAGSLALQALAVYLPVGNLVLHTVPLGARDGLAVVALNALALAAVAAAGRLLPKRAARS